MHDQQFLRLVTRLQADGPVVWIDGAAASGETGGFSYLAGLPEEILSINADNPNGWLELEHRINRNVGWWFGAIAYEAGDPAYYSTDRFHHPLFWFMRPGFLAVKPPGIGDWSVIIGDKSILKETSVYSTRGSGFGMTPLVSSIQAREYSGIVELVKQDIREGEYYELNFTYPVRSRFSGDPLSAYLAGRQIAKAPFSAFIDSKNWQLLSFSPERFLSKTGNQLVSEPIKGTRQNVTGSVEEMQHLLTSEKDRAELLMIVDLVRNDLSTICDPGSVIVDRLFEIRSYETVHQMVATVRGRLAENKKPVEALKNCFPMGSMTGAPKMRVMERIRTLETGPRGFYSGSTGYFTPAGDFDFNVVIRSLFIQNGTAVYGVGGAVTADSSAVEEWNETLVKQRILHQLYAHRKTD